METNYSETGGAVSYGGWWRVKLTLFSMMVSASFLAAYSVSTFYTTVVIVVGGAIRPILINYVHKSWQYETTHPDPLIRLIEAIVMKRHEEDLVGEEELYRMLQEILRQPELIKCLTGSTLKGSSDPIFDKMTPEERRKLEHLETLERKGFEVGKLKDEMVEAHKKKTDGDF
jgi:hypothetical protein